jgi:hypothetical protein
MGSNNFRITFMSRHDALLLIYRPHPFRAILRGDRMHFVTHFLPGAACLISSTYLGGRDNEAGYGIAVDCNGYIYVNRLYHVKP